MEEFARVISARETDARSLESVLLSSEVEVDHLRATVRDQVLRSWLASSPEGAAKWLGWDAFIRRCEDLSATLKAIGCETGASGREGQSGLRSDFMDAIERSLESRGSGRGDWNIEHDADLLLSVFWLRTENPSTDIKAWPGATVASTDTHLVESYRAVQGEGAEHFPAAMTLGQWAAVLAKCSDPLDAEALAIAISQAPSAQSILSHAATVPVEAAIELARSLKGTPPSGIALESVQLSLDEVLNSQYELDGSALIEPRQLAGKVLADRHSKFENVAKQHRVAAREAAVAGDKHRAVREANLLAGQRAATDTAQLERERADRLATENAALEATLDNERVTARERLRRTQISVVLVFLLAAAVVGLAAEGAIGGGGTAVASIGTAIVFLACVDWTRNLERNWIEIGVPALASSLWLAAELILGSASP